MLGVLSTFNYQIRVDEFRIYCLETARLYVQEYDWYYMPTAMHEILMHGYQIIEAMALPIGMFSEEAQEARNKEIKKYRELYSRKTSR